MMNSNELIERIRTERTAVFGTGYVAGMLWKGLEIHHVETCPDFFLVSKRTGETFLGRPVRLLSETAADERLILIAVHEANYREADRILAEAGWKKRVWIYPYLHELLFGPVLVRKHVSMKDLLRAQDREKYWLAVRMCGIEGYKDIYCKLMAEHASRRTAELRYETLQALKQNMTQRGFDENCPILIDEQYRIIDGLHRVALCRYLGAETIPAEIVRSAEGYEQLFGEENQLPMHILKSAGLTERELKTIEQVQQRLFKEGEY